MSSLGLGGLCFAEPFVTAGAWVIGIVVCVVDPELGLLCECDEVPFEDGWDTDREGVERGVVELLVREDLDFAQLILVPGIPRNSQGSFRICWGLPAGFNGYSTKRSNQITTWTKSSRVSVIILWLWQFCDGLICYHISPPVKECCNYNHVYLPVLCNFFSQSLRTAPVWCQSLRQDHYYDRPFNTMHVERKHLSSQNAILFLLGQSRSDVYFTTHYYSTTWLLSSQPYHTHYLLEPDCQRFKGFF